MSVYRINTVHGDDIEVACTPYGRSRAAIAAWATETGG